MECPQGYRTGYGLECTTTMRLKIQERNHLYADITLTVPHGSLYSMSSENLALNKKLVGVVMMHALSGDGEPWGDYGDLEAG